MHQYISTDILSTLKGKEIYPICLLKPGDAYVLGML